MMQNENIEIVIIEDEEDILDLLEYHLTKSGYAVSGFLDAGSVEQFLEEENPALMIVDRNLPGIEGSEFVALMRGKGHSIPVIFLTAKDKEDDLLEGFKRGGDDYITKPFRIAEVLVRVEALLKRTGSYEQEKLKYRDLVLDIAKRELTIDNKKIGLTNLEFKLLLTFVRRPELPLERDYLRDEVWGDDSVDFHDKTINVAINRLKKKIDPQGSKNYFEPIWGVGYKLV